MVKWSKIKFKYILLINLILILQFKYKRKEFIENCAKTIKNIKNRVKGSKNRFINKLKILMFIFIFKI